MTVFPFQINEVAHLYNRVSKLKPSALLERDRGEPQDKVHISPEGKNQQLLEHTRSEAADQKRRKT